MRMNFFFIYYLFELKKNFFVALSCNFWIWKEF